MNIDRNINHDEFKSKVAKYFEEKVNLQQLPNPFSFLDYFDATNQEFNDWCNIKSTAGDIRKWRRIELEKARNKIKALILNKASDAKVKNANQIMNMYKIAFEEDSIKAKVEITKEVQTPKSLEDLFNKPIQGEIEEKKEISIK